MVPMHSEKPIWQRKAVFKMKYALNNRTVQFHMVVGTYALRKAHMSEESSL